VELAELEDAQVMPFTWSGRYPKKRQWCLDNLSLKHDRVFFVDADEEVTKELAAEIAALDFRSAGYFVPGRYVMNGSALKFETHEPDTFSPETRVLLELLADQVAGAIHQAELNRRLAATRDLLARANRDLQMANRELETLARTDPLTGCANRRHFEEVLPLEWRRAARSEGPLCLLLVDVDYFKSLNDSRGHREGDRCLERVARALGVASGRAGDVVARYGGDEFALLLPGLDAAAAAELGERIRAAVEALRLPHGSPPAGPTVTVSVGAASRNPASGGSPEELFEAADRGLAMAKARGRNAVGRSGQLDQGG
jgi:diguanylate cyclase (GGDEF)-like protein